MILTRGLPLFLGLIVSGTASAAMSSKTSACIDALKERGEFFGSERAICEDPITQHCMILTDHSGSECAPHPDPSSEDYKIDDCIRTLKSRHEFFGNEEAICKLTPAQMCMGTHTGASCAPSQEPPPGVNNCEVQVSSWMLVKDADGKDVSKMNGELCVEGTLATSEVDSGKHCFQTSTDDYGQIRIFRPFEFSWNTQSVKTGTSINSFNVTFTPKGRPKLIGSVVAWPAAEMVSSRLKPEGERATCLSEQKMNVTFVVPSSGDNRTVTSVHSKTVSEPVAPAAKEVKPDAGAAIPTVGIP